MEYALSPNQNENFETVLADIRKFCFPDLTELTQLNKKYLKHNLETESFTFILTRQNANRLYGFSRRFIAPDRNSAFKK